MDRPTPTVAELVRTAVEVCDPQGHDPALTHLETQLEDDDEPITAVDNIEERLAIAAEGADYDVDDPAVSVATAVVIYLARHRGHVDHDRDPRELINMAVESQWHGEPPHYVADWVEQR
jgi:hypothetical protein